MTVWAALVLICGGLFAGSVMAFAWDRVSAWRTMPVQQFMGDFDHTISRADKIQPALLVVAIVAGLGFAVSSTGLSQILAVAGAAGFLLVLVASLGILVPLQRRILRTAQDDPGIDEMRRRWFSGHLGRTVVSVASFVLTATAVAL